MRLHGDEPTLIDQLGRFQLVQRVGDDIATCNPPHVFGIHGDWGSGKTSFLHQLYFYLAGHCPQQQEQRVLEAQDGGLATRRNSEHITVAWFEAWRYQHEQAPIIALLQEIRAQLPWYSKALSEARKLSEVTVRSALLMFDDLTKKIGVQSLSKIIEVGEKWEQENIATLLPAHMIRQHLEHALGKLLGDDFKARRKHRPRLVVIVDDLDRCDSEAAYKLLEGIKIYLNLPNCVFVLGMNQRIIESAIAKHLPDAENSSLRTFRAREYLEKICYSIEHLPVVREPAKLLRFYMDNIPEADAICAVIAEYGCLPANPRKIKSYSNLLRRYVARFSAKLKGPAQEERTAQLVTILSCLYQFHPDLYRILEAHPLFYEQIRRWSCQDGTAMEHPAFRGIRLSERTIQMSGGHSTPTSEPLLESAFADPSEGDVLRLQKLIRTLGPVTQTEILYFLI